MAGAEAPHLTVLDRLATANSLFPFAQQLQALQQIRDQCTVYSSEPESLPDAVPSQSAVQAQCSVTANGLKQLTKLLQQWLSSSNCKSDSTTAAAPTATADAQASTTASSSSSGSAGQPPPQLSWDNSSSALQAVLLLLESTYPRVDAMRKAVSIKAQGGMFVLLAGLDIRDAPPLQTFVKDIQDTGLITSFCGACDALTATFKHHPAHLSPATTSPPEQHHSTLQLLHSIAAALFELFYLLSATWPRNSQIQIKTTHTGLLNPTLRPIVRPAVRLCVAMLTAVCAPPSPPVPSAPVTSKPAAATSDTCTPRAAAAASTPAASTPAAAAAQAPVLRAALLFGFTMANTLHELVDKASPTDRDMAAFMKTVLIGLNGSDDFFQLFLIVLTVLAQKRYNGTGGVSVWGDRTAVEPYHLQLLQYLGLAPLSEALLVNPDAVPHPYTDDNNNAVHVTFALDHTFTWTVHYRRKDYLAAHPGGSYATSHMPPPLAKALSLTLLEMWSLVKEKVYIRNSSMTLLAAPASFLFGAPPEVSCQVMQLLEATWCIALPGAAASVQWRGRPLAYEGVDSGSGLKVSFQSEQMVAEVSMHLLYAADRMCRQLLQGFVVANPGAAAAGAEWGFRWRGQQLTQQPGPLCINQNTDDPADNILFAQHFLDLLLVPTDGSSTPDSGSTTTTTSTSISSRTSGPQASGAASASACTFAAQLDSRKLHPELATALSARSQDTKQLWLLLVTLNKFAAAVAAERPKLRGQAVATMRGIAAVGAAMLREATPGSSSNSGNAPACWLLGVCLVSIGAAAESAPTATWVRKLPGLCLEVMQLLQQELGEVVTAVLSCGRAGSNSAGGSNETNASSRSSSERIQAQLMQLQTKQEELEQTLAKPAGGSAAVTSTAQQLQQHGAMVCALLPSPGYCNNPSCYSCSPHSFAGQSEAQLGHHKCGGCKAATYCSRDCQREAWEQHKPVCKAMAAARPGKAAKKA